MKRRNFIQTSALASASFLASSGLLFPQPSNAFIFALLGGELLSFVFGMFLRGAFAMAINSGRRRNQEWYDKRLDAQLAQQELLDKLFVDVNVAEVENLEYDYVLAAIKEDRLGKNVAISLPRFINNRAVTSTFSGSASIGIAAAAKYLRENTQLNSQQIQRAILPPVNSSANFNHNFNGWEEQNIIAYPNSYNPGSAGVLITYTPINSRLGGYGKVSVEINANSRIVIPDITVKYSSS